MLARHLTLAVFLFLVTVAVLAGSLYEAGQWYFVQATKPSWAPQPWLNSLAWAIVYLLMALAAWDVWLTGHYDRFKALGWWISIPVLMVVWSALMFGFHRPGWSWLVLTMVIALTLMCIRAFRSLSREASYLMIPGLLWMLFFWANNFAIWNLSGGPLASYLGR
jgi:tryptophan-rich sensory protein